MSAHPPAGADGKMFLVIYLVLSVVVGGAVYFVIKGEEKQEAARMAEMIAKQEKAAKEEKEKAEREEAAKKGAEAAPKEAGEDSDAMMVKSPPKEEKPKAAVVRKPPIKVGKEKVDPEAELRKEVEQALPYPAVKDLMEIVKNWKEVPKNAYPKLVEIRQSVEFEVVENGKAVAKGRLPTGAMMIPVLLEEDTLTVTMGTGVPVNVKIPVDETDFKEQVQARYDAYVAKSHEEVDALREAEVKKRLGSMREEKALFGWNDGADPRFDVLKQSLKQGEVGDYSLIDVLKWKWGAKEDLDGRQVDTAHVLLLSQEPFGEVEVEVRAFIEDGKVLKWVDIETKTEL